MAALLTGAKIAGALPAGKMGGAIVSGGAKALAKRSSISGGAKKTIGKEPIWSSGTTSKGEYLSAGDRKALFRKNKISGASFKKSSALGPIDAGDPISNSEGLTPSSGGAITPQGLGLTGGQTDLEQLEKRVANNEQKITTIKKIIKIQQQPYGGKENPLDEVSDTLEDIGNALAKDFANRITEKETEISALKSSADSKKRGNLESGIETVNKISSKVGTAFSAVTAPAKNILDKMIGFFGNLAAGFIADKALKWLSKNEEFVIGFFKFLGDHGAKIAAGLGILVGGIIVKKFVKVIVGVCKFVGGAINIIKNAIRIAKSIFKYGKAGKIASRAATALFGKKGMKRIKGIGKGLKGMGKGIVNAGKSGVKGAKNLAKGAKAIVKGGGKGLIKGLGKAGGKGLLKKIPIVGLGMGAAFAVGRLLSSPPDWMGAALELGSGAASMIPGVGTALSVALDAGSMVRDHKKSKSGETETADISSVEQDYKSVVNTATQMDFSGNVKSTAQNLQAPSKSGVTVMDTVKLGDMANAKQKAGIRGDGDSMPIIGAEDPSNFYPMYVKEELGIFD